jgi:hypothetical protein
MQVNFVPDYVSIDLKAGPYQHDTIAKAARKQCVSPFALTPPCLHLELIRHMVAVLVSGVGSNLIA